jgi:hypothetical protein
MLVASRIFGMNIDGIKTDAFVPLAGKSFSDLFLRHAES